MNSGSLRSRLVAGYVAVLFLGLLVFAAIATFAIDRALRSTLDAGLMTEAKAASSFVDVVSGRIVIDSDARTQFLSVMGVANDGVIVDRQGRVVLSSTAKLPPALLALRSDAANFFTIGKHDTTVRALVWPLIRSNARVGSVVVWRSSDWIDETDRGAAIAFAVASLVIAALALAAGSTVTRRALDDAFSRQRRFTADASHDLRAPLAVIRAEADLALLKERGAAEYRRAIGTIAEEADRMESLIGSLLSAARAQSKPVRRERVDLSAIAVAAGERLRTAARAKGIGLGVDADGHAWILADGESLESAVLAIGHNAVKYAPRGGNIGIAVARHGPSAELSVRDDGPGFSAAALDRAFEPFWQDDPARSQDGSGLGLAIAKSIVESSGGRIALHRSDMGGAEVRLRFTVA